MKQFLSLIVLLCAINMGWAYGNKTKEAENIDSVLTDSAVLSQEQIEATFGKTFDINKYIEDMNMLTDGLVPLTEYALVDIDHDGKPEIWGRNAQEGYDIVYALVDEKLDVLGSSSQQTELVIYEHGVGAQGTNGNGGTLFEYTLVKGSVAVCHIYWDDGDFMDDNATSTIEKDGKACSEEEAQDIISKLGEQVELNPVWHKIN